MDQNYTKIENELLEKVLLLPLTSTELKCLLYLIRKTNGYHKDSTYASYAELARKTGCSLRAVKYAMERLRVVQVVALRTQGNSRGFANTWAIEKDANRWKVVQGIALVQNQVKGSANQRKKVVQGIAPLKESNKRKNKRKGNNFFSAQPRSQKLSDPQDGSRLDADVVFSGKKGVKGKNGNPDGDARDILGPPISEINFIPWEDYE